MLKERERERERETERDRDGETERTKDLVLFGRIFLKYIYILYSLLNLELVKEWSKMKMILFIHN